MSNYQNGVISTGDASSEVNFSTKGAITGFTLGTLIGTKFGGPIGSIVLGTAFGLTGLFLGPKN